MSKYTTELRFICENYAGKENSEGYNSVASIIDASRGSVFDFDYPIFDESYRNVLETKILRHFYLREICAETVGIWKHFLNMRMNEIMPYYNKLYESELIEFNPLYDVDLTKDYNKDDKGTGTVNDTLNSTDKRDIREGETIGRVLNSDGTYGETGNGTDTGTIGRIGLSTSQLQGSRLGTTTINESDVNKETTWDVYSDTPQGGLTNVENDAYLTNARKIIKDGTGSAKTGTNGVNEHTGENGETHSSDTETRNLASSSAVNGNTNRKDNENINRNANKTDNDTKNSTNIKTRNLRDIEDYIEHVKGKTGGVSFSKLLQEFRETFLNIDMMIINDLNDLFFGLW